MRTIDSIAARGACLLLLGITACGFSFNPQSLVKSRMILGMRAEPPEVIVEGFNNGVPLLSASTVTLSALVVDPSDTGENVPYVWDACSETLTDLLGANGQWDDYEQRCDQNAATLLTQGSEPLAEYACDVPGASIGSGLTCPNPVVTLSPFTTLLNLVTNGAGISALTGSSGSSSGATAELSQIEQAFTNVGTTTPAISLWVDTMLQVDDGTSPALYGINRVVVSPDAPPSPNGLATCGLARCPNNNPQLTALLFDYQPWEPDVPLNLQPGNCSDDKKVSVPNPDGHGTVAVCQHTITPVFDPSQDETYVVQTLTKNSNGDYGTLTLQEYLRFEWSIDQGSVDNSSTTQPTNVGPQEVDPISTHWAEPPTPTASTMNLWVVTTDGRGGTSWDHRQINFVSGP